MDANRAAITDMTETLRTLAALPADQAQTLPGRFYTDPDYFDYEVATLLVSFGIQPLAVDRIRVRWTLSTYGIELTQDELDTRIALWREVNLEDRIKLEKMQQALTSRHATSGLLASEDYEGTIADFHRYLARQMAVGPKITTVA